MKKYIICLSAFLIIIFIVAIIMGQRNDSKDPNDDTAMFLSDDISEVSVSVSAQDYVDNNNSTRIYSALEMPRELKNDTKQILYRKGYTVSYNKHTKCPNWVAWLLTAGHTDGPYSRKGVPYYLEDGSVVGIGNVTPETCRNGYFVDMEAEEPRQQLDDWTREYNMSHGHICPAGDNKWDKAAMNQSFLLTNICPQDEKLNGGGWKKLEEKCRAWANRYGEIFIVAGPVFHEPILRTMGQGKIAIPDAFYKVVLCLKGTPKAIGFVYKNDSSSQSIKNCAFSVDDVEEITGFDFFHTLSDSVEVKVEAYANLDDWNL